MKLADTVSLVLKMSAYDKKFKKINMTKRENMLIAYKHGTPPIIPNLLLDGAIFMARPEMERYIGYETGKDEFGVTWKYEPKICAPMTVGEPLFTEISEWREKVTFPDIEAIDWKAQAERDVRIDFVALNTGKGLKLSKEGTSAVDGGKLGFCMVLNGMFERMHALMGFENALIALLDDPDSCFEFFSAMADHKIAHFRKIKEFYPVDVIDAHDDYGSADQMFMSPETWRKLIKPNLKRMVDACHEMGLIYEHHSCGYIEPIIPDLVEIGVDAWDPVQVVNKNIVEIKKKFGDRLTFLGGIDNVGVEDRIGVTDEEVFSDYRRAVDTLAPGGSYISFPATATTDPVPLMLLEHLRYAVPRYSKAN